MHVLWKTAKLKNIKVLDHEVSKTSFVDLEWSVEPLLGTQTSFLSIFSDKKSKQIQQGDKISENTLA